LLTISSRSYGKTATKASPVDLSDLTMTHYRLSKQATRTLKLNEDSDGDDRLSGMTDIGSGRFKDEEIEFLSVIIARLNDIFAGEFTSN